MRLAVRMSQPVTTTLRADNHRSEHRWERQLVDALLQNECVSFVHSVEPRWLSTAQQPGKFVDGLRADDVGDAIIVSSEVQDLYGKLRPKAWVLIFYSYRKLRPTEELFTRIEELKAEYGERLILFYPYKDSEVGTPWDRETGSVDVAWECRDHLENLCMPIVPGVTFDEAFDRKILLVSVKHLLSEMDAAPDEWELIFDWVAYAMRESAASDVEIHFVTGYEQADFDFRGWTGTLDEQFWSRKISAKLEPFRERVRLHMAMGWEDVLRLFSQTKLVVNMLAGGNSPVEAAAHGVPFVSFMKSGPMKESSGLAPVYSPHATEQALRLLDQMFVSRELCAEIADKNRSFVTRHYTATAFNVKLNEALSKRGLL